MPYRTPSRLERFGAGAWVGVKLVAFIAALVAAWLGVCLALVWAANALVGVPSVTVAHVVAVAVLLPVVVFLLVLVVS